MSKWAITSLSLGPLVTGREQTPEDGLQEEPGPRSKQNIRGCMTKKRIGVSRYIGFSAVQVSHSAMSDSLQPHELQHARPPRPSRTPGVYSNSCPSSQWWHPNISSSVIPFSSCPQSLPASGSFPTSQLFASGGQSMEFQLQQQSFQWTPRTDLL